MLRGRAVGYGLVLGFGAIVLAGASVHSAAVIFGGVAAVAALVLVLAFAAADRRAAEDFFRAYAAGRGLTHLGEAGLLPLTPLLAAGDRRRFQHWMQGPLPGGIESGLGHYTFEVRKGSGREQRREKHQFTVCVVDLEAAMGLFPGIFLTRRRGVFGALDGHQWLSHRNRHEVQLESAKLCERYELWVDDTQNELLLRELFAPSLVVLLAEHPLGACFEYRSGTLVVYIERRLEDEAHLDWMREVTAKIVARIAAEAAEQQTAA